MKEIKIEFLAAKTKHNKHMITVLSHPPNSQVPSPYFGLVFKTETTQVN